MLRLSPAALLDGVLATLEHDIAPAVAERAARGLLFAAIEVIANVKDLVEWKAAIREEELTSATDALAAAARAFVAAGLAAEAGAVGDTLVLADGIDDREERGRTLDAALERVLVVLDEAGDNPDVGPAREAVRGHLVNQTVRDVMRMQRPLLARISQG